MSNRLFFWVAFLLAALMVTVDLTRPPIPVDETRYLTVAWEFWTRGQWILPTLNFEPYHHKPPILFWLINACWHIIGQPDLWVARLVPYAACLGVLVLTDRLGRLLWPDRPMIGRSAALMFAATPFFLIYGTLIMFDMVLAVTVLGGIYALIQFYTTSQRRWFLLLGVMLGLGILTKGPVALLHLLPVIILFPIFNRNFAVSRVTWAFGSLGAIVIAAIIALAWALPAAHLGGPKYEEMIFWGQSAGRIVKSFDHAEPWWFYIAFMPALLLPWPFVPMLWRNIRRPHNLSWQSILVLCWTIPVFIAFCAISGKQVHYLLPIFPGFFLLVAHHINVTNAPVKPLRLLVTSTLPLAIILCALGLIESWAHLIHATLATNFIIQMQVTNLIPMGIGFAALGALFIYARYQRNQLDLYRTLTLVIAAQVICVITIHATLRPMLFKYYDLQPIATAIQPYLYDDKIPVAAATTTDWHGEIGYMARQTKPLDLVNTDQADKWFQDHPHGILLIRHDQGNLLTGYKVLFTQDYRSPRRAISLISKPETASHK